MAVKFIKVVGEEEGMRLDRWFKIHFPQLPHAMLNKILRKGEVRVDRGRVKINTRLQEGQEIRVPPLNISDPRGGKDGVVPPLSAADRKKFQDMVLYEDKDLFVINKPSGLAVQGGSKTTRHVDGMLMGMEKEFHDRPRLVHRLDRDTSGVLVIAKRRSIAARLGKMFQTRTVHKFYWAAVIGMPEPLQGKIEMALIKAQSKQGERVRMAHLGEDGAQRAVTHYSVIDRAGDQMAWVSLKPVTGRQHQLRAHMAFTGTPICGDQKYDGLEDLPDGVAKKLHLHARRISFPHPRGGVVDVTAPLPSHMRATWNFYGFDPNRYDRDLEEE
jgi:23S rRNA pseudouridine955/2504/2580 synthase